MKKNILLLLLLTYLTSCMPMPSEGEKSKLVFRAPNSKIEKQELEDYSSELQMVPRTYAVSVLKEFFSTAGTDSDTYINLQVGRSIHFGGACDKYEPSDLGTTANAYEYPEKYCYDAISVTQKATNNPMRFAIANKVCEKLAVDRATNVRNKYFGSSWPTVNRANVKKIWDQFYPTDLPSDDILDALVAIRSVSANDTNAWRGIIVAVCSSPQWQTF